MWYRTEFELTCSEQAFGRAGNWGEGKAKRALSPSLSLPFPRYFFPKQRACSQAKFELNVLFIDLPTYKKNAF